MISKRTKAIIIAVIILAILCAFIFIPLPVYDGAYVGMSYIDFINLFPREKAFHYFRYSFYTNSLGDYVVARHHNDTIVELKSIRKLTTNPSEATFNRIKEGTDLMDVVAMVGIPAGSYTSGMSTCYFYTNNGSRYTIYWDWRETENGIKYVSSSILKN